jgi:hypothetical protein
MFNASGDRFVAPGLLRSFLKSLRHLSVRAVHVEFVVAPQESTKGPTVPRYQPERVGLYQNVADGSRFNRTRDYLHVARISSQLAQQFVVNPTTHDVHCVNGVAG